MAKEMLDVAGETASQRTRREQLLQSTSTSQLLSSLVIRSQYRLSVFSRGTLRGESRFSQR